MVADNTPKQTQTWYKTHTPSVSTNTVMIYGFVFVIFCD